MGSPDWQDNAEAFQIPHPKESQCFFGGDCVCVCVCVCLRDTLQGVAGKFVTVSSFRCGSSLCLCVHEKSRQRNHD